MRIVDAPSREACMVRRERTNTPLQALLLMNEQEYVEAARALADRAVNEAGPTPVERLSFMFRAATGRRPDGRELAELAATYLNLVAKYGADREAATKLVAVGGRSPDPAVPAADMAAYTMVANLILNLDEVLTKG